MRDGTNKTSLLANDPDVSLPYLIKYGRLTSGSLANRDVLLFPSRIGLSK